MKIEALRVQLKDNGVPEDKIEAIIKSMQEDDDTTDDPAEVSVEAIIKALDGVKTAMGAPVTFTPEVMAEEIKKAVADLEEGTEKRIKAIGAATDQRVARNEERMERIEKALVGCINALNGLAKLVGGHQESIVKAISDAKPEAVDDAGLVEKITKAITTLLPPEPLSRGSAADIIPHPGDKPEKDTALTPDGAVAIIQKAVRDLGFDAQIGNKAIGYLQGSAANPEQVLKRFNVPRG